MKKGRLFWITGLSCAGKTTVGKLIYQYLCTKENNVVFIDGDMLREVYQNTDYSEEGRKKIAYTNMRLCKMLTDQGIDVIIAVIGLRSEYWKWNRENIENYYEIYLKVPMEVLIARDNKKLYRRALNHEISNVYGVDMPFEEPSEPTVVVINDSSLSPVEVSEYIIKELGI